MVANRERKERVANRERKERAYLPDLARRRPARARFRRPAVAGRLPLLGLVVRGVAEH